MEKLELLHKWYKRIRVAQKAHYQDAERLKRLHYYLGVPVIIFSAVIGTSVFVSLSEDNPSIPLRIIVGVISISATILSSLQTFLNYSEQSAKHFDSGVKLSSLKKEIEAVLAISFSTDEEINEFIITVRKKWDEITKEAPLLSQSAYEKNFSKLEDQNLFLSESLDSSLKSD